MNKRPIWTGIGLFLVVALVMIIPAIALGIYWADAVCRGVQCSLEALLYGIPAIWTGLTALGCVVMWLLERRR